MKRAMAPTVIVLLLVVGGMYLRAAYESWRWLETGRRQLNDKQYQEALISLRRSVSWPAPGFTSSKEAFDELTKLSISDPALTEEAPKAALRGLKASRSFLDSFSGRDAETMTVQTTAAAPQGARELVPPAVDYRFQALAQICFFGWVAAVLMGIWKGFDSRGKLRGRPLVKAAAGWALFFSLWLLALRLA